MKIEIIRQQETPFGKKEDWFSLQSRINNYLTVLEFDKKEIIDVDFKYLNDYVIGVIKYK